MIRVTSRQMMAVWVAVALAASAGAQATQTQDPPALTAPPAELGLGPERAAELQSDLASKDLRAAEALLLQELHPAEHTPHTAALLRYLGGIYFLAGDYTQAAVAWKKADALTPLQPTVRFSLAMAYVRLGHEDWARPELVRVAADKPDNALYIYWVGRLDYDAQQYQAALGELQQAIRLDPAMVRAHDSLGLCLFYLNRNDAALAEFRKAIALAGETPAAAWPHADLGTALAFTGDVKGAIAAFQHALALNPALPKTQFALGNALEREGHLPEARAAFLAAAQLDPGYPEPHVALARLLRREGNKAQAQEEVRIYETLHAAQNKRAPAAADAPK